MINYSYYGKICTLIYDFDKPEAQEDEFALIKQEIKSKDDIILEPMCGSGRFLVPFLKLGNKVEGLDLSADMLGALSLKLEKEKLNTNLYQTDLKDFKNNMEYDLIYISSGSISLFTEEKILIEVLTNIHSHLKKGCSLVLSYINPGADYQESDDYKMSNEHIFRDQRIIEYCMEKFDKEKMIINYFLRYKLLEKDTVIEREEMILRVKLYSFQYLTKLLLKTGFRDVTDLSSQIYDRELSYLRCLKTE